jgi:hypothetical protein
MSLGLKGVTPVICTILICSTPGHFPAEAASILGSQGGPPEIDGFSISYGLGSCSWVYSGLQTARLLESKRLKSGGR